MASALAAVANLAPILLASTGGNVTVNPSAGHLVFTGYAPAVRQDRRVSPSVGHLVFTGKVPTRTITSNDITVAPSTGHLVFTGKVPTRTISGDRNVRPATGHLRFTGYRPAVNGHTAHGAFPLLPRRRRGR